MNTPMYKQLLAALFILALPNLSVLAEETEEAETIYKIELIAFKQDTAPSSEIWPLDPEIPDASKARATLVGKFEEAGSELISEEELEMGPLAHTLERRGLTPLLHIGWEQPMQKWKSEDWRWIETNELMGLLRVTKGRFLHIDLDLLYFDPVDSQSYSIKSSRKMRSEELHHIDHPIVGVLVEIKEKEQPEEDLEEEPESPAQESEQTQ